MRMRGMNLSRVFAAQSVSRRVWWATHGEQQPLLVSSTISEQGRIVDQRFGSALMLKIGMARKSRS